MSTGGDIADKRREAMRRLLAQRGLNTRSEAPITAHPERGSAPLSYPQRQLWLFEQMFPDTGAYNVPAAVRLTGTLDVPALQAALDASIARHSVVRATFGLADSEPRQRFAPAPDQVVIQRHDLTGQPSPDREQRARELARSIAARPFDLTGGPSVAVHLITTATDEHVLVLTMHHLVGDAWSWGVLLREVAAGYDAVLRGEHPAAGPLPVHYGDFARWHRDRLDGAAYDDQLAFWQKTLADPPPVLELPADRPRPLTPAFRGDVVDFDLDAAAVAGLRELGRQEGATLFMTAMAALDVLLYRYTGRTDFLVATSVANRGHSQVEPMIGLFVNTLLLRARIDGDRTFREVVRHVREVAGEALVHQEVPFEKVVERLRPDRTAGAVPYFQVMCTLRSAPAFPAMAGLRLSDFPLHNGTSKRDLTLNLVEDGSAVRGQFEYDTELFDRETVTRLAAHLRQLVTGALAAPDTPVGALSMLTDTDHAPPAEPAVYPEAASCVHELFAEQAARTPDAVAVRGEDTELTFAELDRLANQLAHLLRAAGVVPERPVGLCLERSPAMAVAVLGVLKAGGAYVPVDPADPAARRAAILRDSGAAVLVHTGAADPGAPIRTVELDPAWTALRDLPADCPQSGAAPGNIAYILYTSGSTGAPKGVAVEHRQIVNYTFAVLDRLGIDEPLSYAMLQPLTVDSCLTMLVPPLVTGGMLHLITRERALDAEALADYLAEHRVDCLKIAPSHLKALMRSGRGKDLLPRRRLVVGGESSAWPWLRSVARTAAPDCQVYNHYGPTETTVGVLTWRVPRDAEPEAVTAPLGRPLPNTTAYVLDRDGREVPVGVPGELCIAGANVARGYVGRPDLTAAAFVPDRLGTPGQDGAGDLPGGEGGPRMYRTGDLVRLRRDGALEFLGRGDDQVKIRGFRVELGEIEAALTDCPLVREGIVVVRREGQDEPRIVGYLVAAQDAGGADTDAVLAYLRERLPRHMVPAALVVLPALPLSAHGKVDRRALPAPTRTEAPALAPRNELERAVADVWRALLGLEEIGLDQNFFDLGGHSLLLIELHQRLWAEVGIRTELMELFRSTTVRAQAALAGHERAPADSIGLDSAKERGRRQHQQLRRRQAARPQRPSP
ncbi:amino acid adenylation domain-containing protein [Streptomyces sp. NPDC006872]|uniref:amino acid adenylation domain-containing protein n=1 Tax=Streptomyces sp. NPDC006872 TaxID=3155720 RepID=UPI0033D831F7